jgi:nitroreductase
MFTKPIDTTIASRHSCRSFDGKALTEADRGSLQRFIDQEATDHRGEKARLFLIEKGGDAAAPVKLGTYGMVKGASLFLAGSLPASGGCLEGYGFAFQKVILYATELGLGSCWLAGTFDRKAFSSAFDLSSSDIIPAVSPIGYEAARRTIRDGLTRAIAGSDRRKKPSELFFSQDGKSLIGAEDARRFATALEAVRLAPSASNKQPWRLQRSPAGFRFCLKRDPGYASFLPMDVQRMDMGIAMCDFQLSAEASGISGAWVYEEDRSPGPEDSEYVVSWVETR